MKQFFTFLAITLLLVSCRNDDFGNGGGTTLQPVSFQVVTKYDASFNSALSKNANVVLANNNTGDTYSLNTDSNGAANFTNVIPGTYKVTVSKKMLADEFLTTFGYNAPTPEVNFNGTQENVIINANVSNTAIELKSAKVGDLLIKQIYYAGSHTTQGASFRDQFIEIYNNSNEIIFADGLYIGQLHGKNNTTVQNYTLPNGQLDWSKSIGMTSGNAANTDYVYADYVLRIPGNGSQYPIKPGESIVIAQNGINHKAPLLDNTGNPVTVLNPALTIDLSQSDFEVYLGDFNLSIGESIFKFDIQNPAVKDMEIAYWGREGYWSNNNDFLMDNPGRDSFVIFRAEDFASYPNYSDPSVVNVVASTKFFKQIPLNKIIDGVDLQNFNPNSQRPKILPSSVDASFTNCDAAFNSQSVIRKTKTTIAGRKVLEDTNNSANDFVKLAMANPKGFAQ